jgi:hypothetical protein
VDSCVVLILDIINHTSTEGFRVKHSRSVNRQTSTSKLVELIEPDRWLRNRNDATNPMQLNWCDKAERVVLSLAFQLGRSRRSTNAELERLFDELDSCGVANL